jgi:hypothetical protein
MWVNVRPETRSMRVVRAGINQESIEGGLGRKKKGPRNLLAAGARWIWSRCSETMERISGPKGAWEDRITL